MDRDSELLQFSRTVVTASQRLTVTEDWMGARSATGAVVPLRRKHLLFVATIPVVLARLKIGKLPRNVSCKSSLRMCYRRLASSMLSAADTYKAHITTAFASPNGEHMHLQRGS